MTSQSTNGSLQPPLAARNGRNLRILAICRISTVNQDERSLADQEAAYREWVANHTELPFNMEVIASQGSGECLDRTEYLRSIELVESGEYDLVITEDLGRICRRVHAHIFCETCEDCQTRLIALNDHVDTDQENWRLCSFFAVMRHETYNRDTSQRIRRSQRNRFSQGGVFQYEIYGYVKPNGARSDEDVYKDPEAEPVYDEWFRMLENGDNFAEVADWLNENGVSTGPYCRSAQWNGPMVGRVTRNPILKGVRERNNRMSRRINRTGRRRSVNAPPEELLERQCPHLAFIEPGRYDRVVRSLRLRNSMYCRRPENGQDPRANIPRRRTRWPGQHVYCGVCGRLYVYGGHGQKDRLMCSGAREHKCWNGVTFDGPDACRRMSSAVYEAIDTLPAFEPEFLAMLQEELSQTDARRTREMHTVEVERQRNQREIDNIVAAIRENGAGGVLLDELGRLEQQKDTLALRYGELQVAPAETLEIPSIDVVKQVAREEFARLSVESQEFARLMRQLLPSIYVFPFRLCDGGALVLRASVTFTAAPLVPRQAAALNGLRERVTGQLRVDLFTPPQREEFRERVVQMRSAGRTEHEIAAELEITKTAAQRAAALQRTMDAVGIADPWLPVVEPPEDYGRLRRHLHTRYRFDPHENFPREWPV